MILTPVHSSMVTKRVLKADDLNWTVVSDNVHPGYLKWFNIVVTFFVLVFAGQIINEFHPDTLDRFVISALGALVVVGVGVSGGFYVPSVKTFLVQHVASSSAALRTRLGTIAALRGDNDPVVRLLDKELSVVEQQNRLTATAFVNSTDPNQAAYDYARLEMVTRLEIIHVVVNELLMVPKDEIVDVNEVIFFFASSLNQISSVRPVLTYW